MSRKYTIDVTWRCTHAANNSTRSKPPNWRVKNGNWSLWNRFFCWSNWSQTTLSWHRIEGKSSHLGMSFQSAQGAVLGSKFISSVVWRTLRQVVSFLLWCRRAITTILSVPCRHGHIRCFLIIVYRMVWEGGGITGKLLEYCRVLVRLSLVWYTKKRMRCIACPCDYCLHV